jgi:hypothetical protein
VNGNRYYQVLDMSKIRKQMKSTNQYGNLHLYLIPDILMWNLSAMITDDNISTIICDKYYKGESWHFLNTLDVDAFMKNLLDGGQLWKVISILCKYAEEYRLAEPSTDYVHMQQITYPGFGDSTLPYKPMEFLPQLVVPDKVVAEILREIKEEEDKKREEAMQRQQQQTPFAVLPAQPPQPVPHIPVQPAPSRPAPSGPAPSRPAPSGPAQPSMPAGAVQQPFTFDGHRIFTARGNPVGIQLTHSNAQIFGVEGLDYKNHLIPAFEWIHGQLLTIKVNIRGHLADLHWSIPGQFVEFWAVNQFGLTQISRQNLFG